MQVEEGDAATVARIVEDVPEEAVAERRDLRVYQLETEQVPVKAVVLVDVAACIRDVMETDGLGTRHDSLLRRQSRER